MPGFRVRVPALMDAEIQIEAGRESLKGLGFRVKGFGTSARPAVQQQPRALGTEEKADIMNLPVSYGGFSKWGSPQRPQKHIGDCRLVLQTQYW